MGICGCGGEDDDDEVDQVDEVDEVDDRADGRSEEFFRLVPARARVHVTVPAVYHPQNPMLGVDRQIIVQCEGHNDDEFDFDGVGALVSLARFEHGFAPHPAFGITMVPIDTPAWRDRDPVDLAEFLETNADTTFVAVIDLNGGDLLDSQQGAQTMRENVIEVIRLAQDNNIWIFEVYCRGNRTDDNLRQAMSRRGNGDDYPHYRVFEKPGTGGACDRACRDVRNRQRFTKAIVRFTNVVVMGFDGTICVGQSIFGGWRTRPTAETLSRDYERGLLDHDLNVITSFRVVACGRAGGPLSSAYTKYRDE